MKKLTAKTGEYINQQQETKGRYVNIGKIMSNDNGEFVLLDPTVSLAGILSAQNALAMSKGQQVRDMIMVSIFEEQPNNQQPQNGQQPQQNAPQQQYQQPNQQPQNGQNNNGW
jgi:CMP-N-acetylneuraminic acid synthetase